VPATGREDTKPIAWFVPEPTPGDTIAGSCRRQTRRWSSESAADGRGWPARRRRVSTARSLSAGSRGRSGNRVFLDHAVEHEQGRGGEDVQRLLEDDDRHSANGSVSGSDRRMVIGCSPRLELAARIRYMKTRDIHERETKFCPARLSSFDRPPAAAILGAELQAF